MTQKAGPSALQDDASGFDSIIEAYKQDLDRTLLRENLRRSITERIRGLNALQRMADEARGAGRSRKRRPR